MKESPKTWALVMTLGSKVSVFPLGSGRILIGRKSADVSLGHPSVSRRHALVECEDGGIRIRDLGSKNGIRINARKVGEGALREGDVLKIGDVDLSLRRLDDGRTQTALGGPPPIGPIGKPEEKSEEKPASRASIHRKVGDSQGGIFFDDASFLPADLTETLRWDCSQCDYIDINDASDFRGEVDVVEYRRRHPSLEVTIFVSGRILSRDYLAPDGAAYYVGMDSGPRTIALAGLSTKGRVPFAEVLPHRTRIFIPPGFGPRGGQDDGVVELSADAGPVSFAQGVVQIFVRYSQSPPVLKRAPLLKPGWRGSFKALTSSVLVASLAFVCLLLDRRIEEPEERKVSVVYKPDPRPLIKLLPTPIPLASVQSAAPKARTTESTQRTQSVKKVGKARALEKKDTPKDDPTPKSYNMADTDALKNLFKTVGSSGSPRMVADSSSSSSGSLTSVREVSGKGAGVSSRGSIGRLGDGPSGGYDLSTQGKGLSGKKGASKVGFSLKGTSVSGGGMDAALIAKILKGLIPQFKHCYQRELVRNRNIEGLVDLNFRITPRGKASEIGVSGNRISFSARGNGCIKKILSLVDFPRPPGGGFVDVRQPLNFSSFRSTAAE